MKSKFRLVDRLPEMADKTLEERVKWAVPRVWQDISADVDWPCSLAEAAELCLDADRPVSLGYMTPETYAEMCELDNDVVGKWAKDVLKGYV